MAGYAATPASFRPWQLPHPVPPARRRRDPPADYDHAETFLPACQRIRDSNARNALSECPAMLGLAKT